MLIAHAKVIGETAAGHAHMWRGCAGRGHFSDALHVTAADQVVDQGKAAFLQVRPDDARISVVAPGSQGPRGIAAYSEEDAGE